MAMKSNVILFWILLPASIVVFGCTSGESLAVPAIVGEWRSSVQFKTGPFSSINNLEFMFVFNLGGTMTESSNYDGAPPVPPAYGIWRSLGPEEFEARYEFYITQAPSGTDAIIEGGGWLPAGRGVFTERIRLSSDGKSFSSTVSYEPLDLEGNPTVGGGEGEGSGVRLEF